ncbi:hypothetical protein VNO77_24243 [Canavalia gladiata]|uniref:Uncharacterized protein n=1 Tax=Canavalia gladiata TaxID=3824 RepID=A0AAN9L980_CANGL
MYKVIECCLEFLYSRLITVNALTGNLFLINSTILFSVAIFCIWWGLYSLCDCYSICSMKIRQLYCFSVLFHHTLNAAYDYI